MIFLGLVGWDVLLGEFVMSIECYKLCGSFGKVNLVFDWFLEFFSCFGDGMYVCGDVVIVLSIDYFEWVYDEVKYGDFLFKFFMNVVFFSLFDWDMVFLGKYVVSIFV